MNMEFLETLLAVSLIFWGVIFAYVLWLDRKVQSLRNALRSLEKGKD